MRAHPRAGRDGPRLWLSLVALQVLFCLGTGFVSALLPDDPNLPPGYYDGDGDDAAATPERLDSAAIPVVDTTGGRPPIQPHTPLGLTAPFVGSSRPTGTDLPLLRAPPA
jgi:hypothetical protein